MRACILASIAAALLGANPAQAEDWNWLASAEEDYAGEPVLSFMAGTMEMDPDSGFDSTTIFGIELAFNSLFLKPPSNRIRQQVSLTRYTRDGVGINIFELNPHYTVALTEHLDIGAGPGLALLVVNTRVGDGDVFGFQLGASLHYFRFDPLFFGAQALYQLTGSNRFGAFANTDLNNTRLVFKAGFSF